MIKAAYERLFVAFYGWSLKVDGKKGGYNIYYASIMLSLALFLNIASVVMMVDLFVPQPFFLRATQISRMWWVLITVSVTAGQYMYFRRGERYLKLIAAQGQDENTLADSSHWKLVAYMVGSVVLVIALLFVNLK